jgi:hypothetical protein
MTPEIRNLLKEARTIIRAHARWSAKDWDERATKALATPPQRTEQEPVAHLWQHGATGRTRVTFPDSVTDCDASWFCVGPLVLGNTTPPQRTEEKNND